MLTIRLTRVGRKNDPSFRVIVIDSKRKVKAGNYLEMLGSYDPRADRTELKADRIKHWLSHGATTSDTVHNLLVSHKIIDAKKINILPKYKAPEVVAQEKAEAAEEKAAEAPETPSGDAGTSTKSEEGVSEAEAAPEGDNAVVEEKPAQ